MQTISCEPRCTGRLVAVVLGVALCLGAGAARAYTPAFATPQSRADMRGLAQTAVKARAGDSATVRMTCANAGPDAALNATCVVRGAPADARTVCTPAWPVARLAAGSGIVCATTFTPANSAPLMLAATAGSNTPDPNRANDTVRALVMPAAARIAAATGFTPTFSDVALIALTVLLSLGALAVHRTGR